MVQMIKKEVFLWYCYFKLDQKFFESSQYSGRPLEISDWLGELDDVGIPGTVPKTIFLLKGRRFKTMDDIKQLMTIPKEASANYFKKENEH